MSFGVVFSQAYKGKGDFKTQVGLDIQKGGTGVSLSTDYGLNKIFSIGISIDYLFNAKDGRINETKYYIENPSYDPIIDGVIKLKTSPEFEDIFDIRARFNANLNNALELGSKTDIYPGLDLGLKNFGAHLGLRYFFTNKVGAFVEGGIPIVKFEKDDNRVSSKYYDYYPPNYNNQLVVKVGVVIDL